MSVIAPLTRIGCAAAAFGVFSAPLAAQSHPDASAAPASHRFAQVAIVGSDYAFLQSPATLPAGDTEFRFENRGTVRHEFSLALLKPGITLQNVLNMFEQGGRRRDLFETSVGVLLAFPKDTSGGRLLVRLIPGRTYAMICSLRDTPDAQPHAMLGMIGAFAVLPTP